MIRATDPARCWVRSASLPSTASAFFWSAPASVPAASTSTLTDTCSIAAGAAIPGLFAVGSCAATTTFGTGYNSGMALSRGLTLAYLVARELTGAAVSV